MERFAPGQIVTVFRSRLRPEHAAAYAEDAARIETLARGMPGLVDIKFFAADDGERLTVVTFADQATHDAWLDQEDHRQVQRRGRADYYAEYSIQVCEAVKAHRFAGG